MLLGIEGWEHFERHLPAEASLLSGRVGCEPRGSARENDSLSLVQPRMPLVSSLGFRCVLCSLPLPMAVGPYC